MYSVPGLRKERSLLLRFLRPPPFLPLPSSHCASLFLFPPLPPCLLPSPPSLPPSLLLPMCLFFSSLHVAWQSQTAGLTGYASTGSLPVRSQLSFMWWTLPDSSRVHMRDRYSMCNCSYHQNVRLIFGLPCNIQYGISV